ncbi:MAG: hypothetical protein HKN04_01040 [Rhodothermaceae bacterium]|nr:hypothetical protein [Rhodothermaceae bacterium]
MLVLTFLLGLLLGFGPSDPEPPPCPGGQALNRAEIEAAGVVYLSDLYRLFDGLRTTTVDGFTWQATHASGVPFEGEAFTIVVDGAPASLSLFDEQDLEGLGVPIHEIASITFCPVSGFVAGQWAAGGTLYIETISSEPGLAARGALQIGNETGDPGPYRYTELVTPNVDKFGVDGEGAVGYRARAFAGRVGLRAYRFFPTDRAQIVRTREATSRLFVRQQHLAVRFDGAAEVLGGTHALTATGHVASDFRFTEAAARELPVRRVDGQGGLRGSWPLGGSRRSPLQLQYRLGLETQTLDADDSALPSFFPDWRSTTRSASLEAQRGPPTRRLAVGATLKQTTVNGPGLPDDAGATLLTLYAQHRHAPRAGEVAQQTEIGAVVSDRHARLKLAQRLGWRSGVQQLALALVLDGQIPEEAYRYGYWAARGYTGLQIDSLPYRALRPPQPSREVSVRLTWAIQPGSRWRATTSLEGRWLRGLYVERPAFVLRPGAEAPSGFVIAVADAGGETVGAQVALEGTHGIWRGRAFYSLLTEVGGTEAFQEVWARVPHYRTGVAITLRPDGDFSLRGALTAESSTRWPGYGALDGAVALNQYVYTDGTPPRWLLDVTADKAFWDRRARLSLVFRNLLNTEERYHPLGAALDLRLYARLTVNVRAQ